MAAEAKAIKEVHSKKDRRFGELGIDQEGADAL